MPRQDVPYPSRAICSLKERIAELEDKIELLMKSINGVQGDGQGNVSLVSGDPAVVINNDQAQHEIEIALDSSQLPAAAVSSVNGQTGAVVLDASNIGTSGGSDVQADLTALGAGIAAASAAVTAEASARASADATLQTNINAVSAGLPAAAAAAVAADPTIAQLQSDVLAIPNKVDKRTGAGVRAYTHDGATQGDTVVLDGTTAATIPIRDANGRLQAADPASGATDKTLVTANWVSQTGTGRPNNLIHDSGNENITGMKNFTIPIQRTFSGGGQNVLSLINASGNEYIYRIYDSNNKDRGYINHQCIISGDMATRLLFVVQSPEYSTVNQTGAIASLNIDLNNSNGRLRITASTQKGDGTSASQTLVDITPT